jgi:hypothetical protein
MDDERPPSRNWSRPRGGRFARDGFAHVSCVAPASRRRAHREHGSCPIGLGRAFDSTLITAPEWRDPELRRSSMRSRAGAARLALHLYAGDLAKQSDNSPPERKRDKAYNEPENDQGRDGSEHPFDHDYDQPPERNLDVGDRDAMRSDRRLNGHEVPPVVPAAMVGQTGGNRNPPGRLFPP